MSPQGIQIPEDLKYFPDRATFDFECYFQKKTQPEMIKQFVDYLVKVSQESYVLLLDRFADVFEQINQRIANSEVYRSFDQLDIVNICSYCDVFFQASETSEEEDEMEDMMQCILGLTEVKKMYTFPSKPCTICTNYFLFVSDE